MAVQLVQKIEQDSRIGYTRYGPHRADIRITSEGIPASKRLSRGQQKLLVYALHLAQAGIQYEMLNESPVLLIDDLSAELDSRHFSILLEHIQDMGMQTIMTSVKAVESHTNDNVRLFHVEHGCLVGNQV